MTGGSICFSIDVTPLQTVRKLLARLKYSILSYTKSESGFLILTDECLTFRTTSHRHHKKPAPSTTNVQGAGHK